MVRLASEKLLQATMLKIELRFFLLNFKNSVNEIGYCLLPKIESDDFLNQLPDPIPKIILFLYPASLF